MKRLPRSSLPAGRGFREESEQHRGGQGAEGSTSSPLGTEGDKSLARVADDVILIPTAPDYLTADSRSHSPPTPRIPHRGRIGLRCRQAAESRQERDGRVMQTLRSARATCRPERSRRRTCSPTPQGFASTVGIRAQMQRFNSRYPGVGTVGKVVSRRVKVGPIFQRRP